MKCLMPQHWLVTRAVLVVQQAFPSKIENLKGFNCTYSSKIFVNFKNVGR